MTFKRTSIAIALSAGLSFSAQSAQEFNVHPNSTVEAVLCMESLSLIRVEGAKIIRGDGVQGTVTTSDPEAIKETGNLLIAPLTEKPFNYYVTDDKGRTWTLRIKPSKKAVCDSLIIKDITNPYKVEAPKDNPSMIKATSRDAIIKSLVQAMYKESSPKDMTVSKMAINIPWWKEAELIQRATYKANGVIGKSFVLSNVDKQLMIVDEREFFLDSVIAVSIEKLQLQPGESTRVFIVYEEDAR